jgi:hypothetical protein
MDVKTLKSTLAAKIEAGIATDSELKMHEIFTILGKSLERNEWRAYHPFLSLFWTPKHLR